MSRWICCIMGLAVALAVGCNGRIGEGDRAEAERRDRVEAGASLFQAYCAACHGGEARGDGPAAAALRSPPADLTRIAARRDGRFEPAEIAAYIDGRNELTAHGRGDMPVWGRLWDDRNQEMMSDETLLSPSMIFAIVAWLESIQEAP